jgi:hypothetical protein
MSCAPAKAGASEDWRGTPQLRPSPEHGHGERAGLGRERGPQVRPPIGEGGGPGPNAKRGRCCHRPHLRFRPGSLDPGRFPIGFPESELPWRPIRDGQSKLRSSLQTFTEQAPLPSVWTSFRQAGDHPGRLSGEPATILFGSFPPGEPGFPTIRFSPGEPFESLPVPFRASSPGGLSRFLCPKAPVPPDSGKVGSALGFPAASRFFPAAPPERPWLPSRRISALSALAASWNSMPFPAGLP